MLSVNVHMYMYVQLHRTLTTVEGHTPLVITVEGHTLLMTTVEGHTALMTTAMGDETSIMIHPRSDREELPERIQLKGVLLLKRV